MKCSCREIKPVEKRLLYIILINDDYIKIHYWKYIIMFKQAICNVFCYYNV